MLSIHHKSGRFLPLVILGALAVAAVLGAMTLRGSPTANAQFLGCDYNFNIVKSAPTAGDTQFTFNLEYEYLYEGNPPITTGSIPDGGCIGITPRDRVTVREVPLPGWRLVDVVCDTTSTVQRTTNGVILEARPQEYVSGVCVFYNARVEQPRQPLNLGGLFAGQPTPLPTAPAAVAPAATSPVISPPRTGDAGLR